MEHPKTPTEIAREAIRRLVARRLPPSPDNFRKVYAEVSCADLPAEAEGPEPQWEALIRLLIKQWDARQAGLSQARKREMLERVLVNFGSHSRQLHDKLDAMARSWSEGPVEVADHEARAPGAAPRVDECQPLIAALANHLHLLASTCEALWPDTAARADGLSHAFAERTSLEAGDLESWAALWREVLVRVEDDHELAAGLKRLMGLLFLNIGELVGDEAWLSGQFAAMQALMAGDLRADVLLEAERDLRELAFRQGALKGNLDEARSTLRNLVNTFIDRVGEMSQNADGYQTRFGEYSERIGRVRDFDELGDLMGGLSADVIGMRDALRHGHAELLAARAQAEQAEQRIHELERELAQTSSLVREDQLTGALNRRGMDEAFTRELARADRLGAPTAMGLLDIDHFKKLNDNLGHQAGDAALRHLAGVIRGLLRPTDVLARYGGEEFLILLPNTEIAEAELVMQRIQRELTRQFFLHDNQRVLITFSAGVAERAQGEGEASLIARADAAMYAAKAHGRNRVERG
jgi:diguanylate cyclase